jgi:Restriction endonuclease
MTDTHSGEATSAHFERDAVTNAKPNTSISSLTPTEFENLTYDTLRAVGLKNLVWRTPGADGGRDIEGHSFIVDLTGHETKLKWYAECKHYQSSIDWPTVWRKISYADGNGADVFLLSTNSNPSPNCESQIALWNSERRRPVIRIWRGYEWKKLISTFSDVALSYGLGNHREPHDAVRPITSVLTKLVHSAYMAQALGQDSTRALEASAALCELISKRLDEIDRFNRFVDVFEPLSLDGYSWVQSGDKAHASASEWDEISLRAVLTYSRYQMHAADMTINEVTGRAIRGVYSGVRKIVSSQNEHDLQVIARWSRLHLLLPDSGQFEVTKYDQ